MAESTTLARPYAKAAFELARDAGQLSEWSALLALTAAVAEDSNMHKVLNHPALTSAQKGQTFLDVCEGKLNEAGANFVRVLAENNRLVLLPEIAALFEQLKAQQEATIEVTIESAFEMNGEQENKLAQALQKKLSRNVNLRSQLNKELIGGIVVRAGDLVIDASVRGRLAKLAEAVNS
ncbi:MULTISPECIES: F0F1 ATP synthase subunit delta [unclassified Hahella]|uniref:F0F1 ATP synthase subunit delta n=1 Tax=unclassified Hahella TaxID=2624107 RepID=UPI001C1EE476|nr:MULTISPECIES: F0F1 ATP synthase subunit delta [unclassified Hahella]MBU6951773.1 F0F1 ATP synthase subunit delta [Hahella sp. HN01]MDG9666511.1 F0F1 ATP synthase subunit delta [Hahella sp. CR1]